MARQAVASSNPAVVSSASDAEFSSDGLYRWWLRRRWRVGSECLLFLGLNPSRADAGRDDPTLRRLIGFARLWGYSELVVLNLFGRVSPSPAALKRVRDPIGSENDITLQQWFIAWSQDPRIDLWFGWGANGDYGQRNLVVQSHLAAVLPLRCRTAPDSPDPFTLGLTRSGQPRHPLYAHGQSCRRPFQWAQTGLIRHPEGIS